MLIFIFRVEQVASLSSISYELQVIYDANDVTLDKMADFTQSEDHAARFAAIGWNTLTIDGHDFTAIDGALTKAKSMNNGKPTIIIAKTVIGMGIPEIEGTNAAHGEAGVKFQETGRANLGLPKDDLWHISDETKAFFADRKVDIHSLVS